MWDSQGRVQFTVSDPATPGHDTWVSFTESDDFVLFYMIATPTDVGKLMVLVGSEETFRWLRSRTFYISSGDL